MNRIDQETAERLGFPKQHYMAIEREHSVKSSWRNLASKPICDR
ncbi:hypothetical protein [Acidovorax sp.]